MNSQVVAYKCPKCNGTGRIKEGRGLIKKWVPCDNCNGVGYLGKDEVYEYYLERGVDGKYRVSGIKHDRFYAEEAVKQEKMEFIRVVSMAFSIIFYIVFAVIYQIRYGTDLIFILVTVVFVLLMFALITNRKYLVVNFDKIFNYLASEPKDFKWALKERRERDKDYS